MALQAPRQILIRSTNWVGDAVMTTPAIAAIRDAYPAAQITVLANPLVAPLFENHPCVNRVIVYDRRGIHSGIGGRWRLARHLRKEGFDAAVLLQNAFDAALIAFLAGIPRRIGYATDGRRLLLTEAVAVTTGIKALHHVDYYLHMLRQSGFIADNRPRKLVLAVTDEEELAATRLLAEAGIAGDACIIGVNPGATYGAAKRWYPERFAAAAEELARRWKAHVVITGGPAETVIAADIERALTVPCLNLAGKTSLRVLLAVMRRLDFLITNDSGPMHIAAAFDVPQVAVFGPTDSTTTSPFSSCATVVRQSTDCAPCLLRECPSDHRCMTAVTASDVVAAAIKLRTQQNGFGVAPAGADS